MMPSVVSRSSGNTHKARDIHSDARAIAMHVSALGRWIEMLQARGVHECDDGLVALMRRQQSLQAQQRKCGLAD